MKLLDATLSHHHNHHQIHGMQTESALDKKHPFETQAISVDKNAELWEIDGLDDLIDHPVHMCTQLPSFGESKISRHTDVISQISKHTTAVSKDEWVGLMTSWRG